MSDPPLLFLMTAGATALIAFPAMLRLGSQSIGRWIDHTEKEALVQNTCGWWLGASVLAIILSAAYATATAKAQDIAVYHLASTELALAGCLGVWAALLAALSRIDLKTRLLPDALTSLALVLGLAFHAISKTLPFSDALIGAAAGYLSLFLVGKAFQIFRGQDAIGRGDFAMLASIGAWLGWQHLPVALLLACLVSLGLAAARLPMVGKTASVRFLSQQIPFGPSLGLGAVAAWTLGS